MICDGAIIIGYLIFASSLTFVLCSTNLNRSKYSNSSAGSLVLCLVYVSTAAWPKRWNFPSEVNSRHVGVLYKLTPWKLPQSRKTWIPDSPTALTSAKQNPLYFVPKSMATMRSLFELSMARPQRQALGDLFRFWYWICDSWTPSDLILSLTKRPRCHVQAIMNKRNKPCIV